MSTPTRFRGQIKSVGTEYGFIDCPETKVEFGRDVYIKRGELPDRVWRVSQIISFEICFSEKGRPQARELRFGPNDKEIPGCSNTIFPETTEPDTVGNNNAPTTEAATEVAEAADEAETTAAAATEDAPAAETPSAAPVRTRDAAASDKPAKTKGTPSTPPTSWSSSSIEQHLQNTPWADVVDDLLDEAGVDDHLDDFVGDEREAGTEHGRVKEKRRNWRRKGLPLRSRPALEEADLHDGPVRRRGIPLRSPPHPPARRPPSHSPPPAPPQVQQGAGRGLPLRVLTRPKSRSSASRSRSPSPPAPANRDGDDPDPLDESFERLQANIAKVVNTPLKADSPEFTPGATAVAPVPTGNKTLSAEAPTFTPGAKAAEVQKFSASGANMQYSAGNVDMYNNGYGAYGYQGWQQGYGGDSNGVYGDYMGYGPSAGWQYGSEMDPNDPKAHPPPFEPGSGKLSANASEFRPGQQAFTAGKGPEVYKDSGLQQQQPTSVDERFIQGQKSKDPMPSEDGTFWDIGAAARDAWIDPQDEVLWGDGDAWHGHRWRRGSGWALDGWHTDDWKRDAWAWDWHGSWWRGRHHRKQSWDDWGGGWERRGEWADRGWRQQRKWRRSRWKRQDGSDEEDDTATESSATESSDDEEVSRAVCAGEAPLPRPLMEESDDGNSGSGTDDSDYNKPAPPKANINAAAFHKIALDHLLGGRRAARQQQQPPSEQQQSEQHQQQQQQPSEEQQSEEGKLEEQLPEEGKLEE